MADKKFSLRLGSKKQEFVEGHLVNGNKKELIAVFQEALNATLEDEAELGALLVSSAENMGIPINQYSTDEEFLVSVVFGACTDAGPVKEATNNLFDYAADAILGNEGARLKSDDFNARVELLRKAYRARFEERFAENKQFPKRSAKTFADQLARETVLSIDTAMDITFGKHPVIDALGTIDSCFSASGPA